MPPAKTMAIVGWSLAAVGLLASIVLGTMLKRRVAIEASLRQDPLGLLRLPAEPDAEQPGPRLLLTGDSRAAQLGKPEFSGWQVLNHGISGQTSDQVAARLARDLLLHSPAHVVMIVGINDLKDDESSARTAGLIRSLSEICRL